MFFKTPARMPSGPRLWLSLAAVSSLLLVTVPVSCHRGRYPPREQPLTLLAVPIIRVRLTSAPVARAEIWTTGGYRLLVNGRVEGKSDAPLAKTKLTREGGLWRVNELTIPGDRLTLRPAEGSFVGVGDRLYRGSLELIPVGSDALTIDNHLDLESYLAGVLPKELYPTWADQTYEALAIAARTFALYHMKTSGQGRDYDLGDDQASQVYGGFSAETEKSWAAVRRTHGVVLTAGEKGQERLFMAQYSACCGGHVNGAEVLRNAPAIEPLRGGQTCNDCARCPRYRWPPVTISKADIYKALLAAYPNSAPALGGVKSISVLSTEPHGRAVWVSVAGPNGRSMRLRAEDIRLALLRSGNARAKRLYSMNCRMRDLGGAIEFTDGRGFGHGVGLCQWGAQGKAEKGWRAEEILRFYYPGAKLFRAY